MDSGPLDWPVGDRRSGDIHLPFIADLYDITTGRTSTRHGVHSLPPALSQLDNSVGHIKDRLRLLAREKMEVSEARELLNHDREMQNRLYQTEMQRMTQRFDKERKHTQALRAAHQEEVERARRRLRAEQSKLDTEVAHTTRDKMAILDLSRRLQNTLDQHIGKI
ncbi:uncharacterized protein LOC101863566 isoform X2 [Aplysia californica]|uniref:Uncharacterized protein LOC101863566 isoform X2 n=1 Tax=Aplysia californica TaxID=6500 RepID=A0ABM1W566_APLCA|nr:uncharacterized protein LOC101863566 isoform X2 [Aplysia californica]